MPRVEEAQPSFEEHEDDRGLLRRAPEDASPLEAHLGNPAREPRSPLRGYGQEEEEFGLEHY